MSCHICTSVHSRLPVLCPTCARNRLYQLRLEHTQILLEKESISNQIQIAVTHDHSMNQNLKAEAGLSETDHDSSCRWALQTILSRQAGSISREDAVAQQIKKLREEIEAKRADILERKARLNRRRSDAESAQYQLGEREAAILTGLQNTTKRTEHLWHTLHSKTAEARIFLCREAAHLYGLRQKASRKGSTPAQISTSLSNIALLLVLVSHYLSLRLPAEIILPHRNHPNPTIYTPAASYDFHKSTDETYMSQPSSSPSVYRSADTQPQPRPRPLFIDRPLPRLAKEDPATYALFLEGATLLAWDVAWLCRAQGINLTSDSWEEVCNIGSGLWQLLVAPPAQPSTLMRAFAGRDTQNKMKPTKDSPQTTIQRMKSFPMLGHYSHGTVHSFLGASEGSEFMRTWKLPTPTKIADKLKSNLLGEMASAEWELLEEQEWEDGTLENQQPPAAESHTTRLPRPSERTQRTEINEGNNQPSRPKGTSGWTKLNSR
ncbi:UV radiation resistance protein/autophagy-related protein 14 [Penicillium odoratum]|uniref:UV radiation resistance protein/autophagy-related protein 14 n=1 Tax=Penicillium odoratum TaxID=1167516 RepID=UPI002548AB32|nr:UV radiation resistance protein/autophagy-related protein 14 [Penicillium odoratum]KAJ5752370.1 UV radiation resistance protein/autophagy-related protein 14 [Penicillium odoratum]